jgi:hypothetical protein
VSLSVRALIAPEVLRQTGGYTALSRVHTL